MHVKTEPSLPSVEEKLSVRELTPELWGKAIKDITEEGYAPTKVIMTRTAKPPFQMHVNIGLVANWDAQLDNADMVVLLRRVHK